MLSSTKVETCGHLSCCTNTWALTTHAERLVLLDCLVKGCERGLSSKHLLLCNTPLLNCPFPSPPWHHSCWELLGFQSWALASLILGYLGLIRCDPPFAHEAGGPCELTQSGRVEPCWQCAHIQQQENTLWFWMNNLIVNMWHWIIVLVCSFWEYPVRCVPATFSSDLPQPLAVVVFTLFLLWVGLLALSIVSFCCHFHWDPWSQRST